MNALDSLKMNSSALEEQLKKRGASNHVHKDAPVNPEDKRATRRKRNIIELTFADNLSMQRLELYRLIYKNRYPLKSMHREKGMGNVLETPYDEFCNYITTLLNMDNVKYCVYNWLFLWDYEKNYRFVFVAIMANYIQEKKIDIKSFETPKLIKTFLCHNMYIQESDVQFSPFISKYTELFDDACYPKKDNAIHEERLSKIRDLMWLAERIFKYVYPPEEESSLLPILDENTKEINYDGILTFIRNELGLCNYYETYIKTIKLAIEKKAFLKQSNSYF